MLVKLYCVDCNTTFKLAALHPNPIKSKYSFCPYCGSPNTTTEQFTTEDYAWQTLATAYNMPQELLETFYAAWAKTPNSPSDLKTYIIEQLEQFSKSN